MKERLARIFGRAMYVLYIVAAVVIIRPDIGAPAAILLGVIGALIIIRLGARDIVSIGKTAVDVLKAAKGKEGEHAS